MKPRIIFIHGNQTTHWSFAWAPWLKAELEKIGFETFFETFPDSIIAREEYWIPFLEDHINAGENDVLVGWSSGGTAALRYAENHTVKGSVLVAPSYTDLNDDLERQSGYFSRPWEWQAIQENQEHIALFCSKNDPYIPYADFEHIASQLHCDTRVIENGGHFIDQTTFPELLAYIKEMYGAI